MNSTIQKKISRIAMLLLSVGALFFLFALSVLAAAPTYTPLVGIPGLTDGNRSFPQYINAVYLLTIVVGALVGVVKISIAGMKYSMSDVVTSKEEAKESIKGVLMGLGILLIPFLVLNTIYPGLTNLDVLRRADKVNLPTSQPRSGAGTTPGGNTAQRQAVETYNNNPANPPTTESQWQFVGVSRDFCTGKASETNSYALFTATGSQGSTGRCEIYPRAEDI